MLMHKIDSELVPNQEFARLASEEQIDAVVAALETRNIQAIVVNNGEEAKKLVLDLVPQGVEVYANVSKTLEDIGVTAEIDKSGRFDAVRPKVLTLDRKTQADEIRILRSRPAYIVGSVHAITEDGVILTASNGGSQIAPYAYGASKVILVVGTQKIVKDLNEGFRRIARARLSVVQGHVGELHVAERDAAREFGRRNLSLIHLVGFTAILTDATHQPLS